MYCSSFSAVAIARLSDRWSTFYETRMKCLMDSTYFQVQSIKKKGKHGKCNVEIHSGKYSTWHMKRIWSYDMNLLIPE